MVLLLLRIHLTPTPDDAVPEHKDTEEKEETQGILPPPKPTISFSSCVFNGPVYFGRE